MTETRAHYHAGEEGAGRHDGADFPAVMTVDQVAAYLQVGARSVYNLAAAGAMPAAKIAGQWRFFRPELDRWLVELSRANVGEPLPDAQIEPAARVASNGRV